MSAPAPAPRHPLWRPVPAAWVVARLRGASDAPDWIPAVVPGAVQLDWAQAKGLPELGFGDNVRLYDGLEDFYWLYRTEVPAAPVGPDEELVFRCAGVDYAFSVRLGGRTVHTQEGMFTPFEVDVSRSAPGTPLEILVQPAPKRSGAAADRTQASSSCKPAVSYGWDWHPRLIPLGIWGDAQFVVRPKRHVAALDFRYTLSEDCSRAEIVVGAATHSEFSWRLLTPDGKVALESRSRSAVLENPRLWWCHDQGQPFLYTLEAALASGDIHRCRVGFRRVRLVMNEGAWNPGGGFPVSRAEPPITVELNGRRIFAKGSNWVSTDVFPGRTGAEELRKLVGLARTANFNLLRCWGGAVVNKEPFFEACDEMGILVWQEFPLACNNYPDDEGYLSVLDQESRSIIGRVRQHPCLALWGGGNELFNSWSGMTDQSLALRLLNRNCYDLDPGTPFIPTAPLEGMGHGDYRFRDGAGREIFEIFQKASGTAYSEFGCPGPASAEELGRFIPGGELWPPRPGTSWQTHHAFGAWETDAGSWLFQHVIEHYFGKPKDLGQLAEWGNWLQCAGYQGTFEEARRQKPRCSMALNWCFNEAWPTAAGNALIAWPSAPKPAFEAARQACRPVLASARIARFQWRRGERFEAELWILNDSPAALPAGVVAPSLVAGGKETALAPWSHPGVPAGTNLRGPSVEVALPNFGQEFELRLQAGAGGEWSSSYRHSLAPKSP